MASRHNAAGLTSLSHGPARSFAHAVIGYDLDYYPSPPVKIVQMYLGLPWNAVSVQFPTGVAIGPVWLPTDSRMRTVVNYRGPARSFPTFAFSRLLAGSIPASLLRDKIVLIGADITGIRDSFQPPFTSVLPGVERLASMVDSTLHGDSLRRLAVAPAIETALLLASAIAIGLSLARLQVLPAAAVPLAIYLLLALGGFIALAAYGLWFAAAVPTAGLLVTFTITLGYRIRILDREHRRVHQAFWNAPLNDPGHAEHACRAALSMITEPDKLNGKWRREKRSTGPIEIGIGINTGTCTVGNFGSRHRFDYSALGDAVNVAARLQEETKSYRLPIIIGPETAARAPMLASLPIDCIRVRGRVRPIEIFGLVGDEAMRRDPAFAHLHQEHLYLRAAFQARSWDLAERTLLDLAATVPKPLEHLYRSFAEWVAHLRLHPPPADWDGSFLVERRRSDAGIVLLKASR